MADSKNNQADVSTPGKTMQAWTKAVYGTPEVLRLTEEAIPVPTDDQVLVEVKATSMNAADWHLTTGSPYLVRLSEGLRNPKSNRTGLDLAGVVAAVGPSVTKWSIGDRVFGDVGGSHADFVAVGEGSIVGIPGGVSFEEAAALPVAGLTALQALRDKAGIEGGQRVLIIGASGSVGTFAIQMAKSMGAHVTAVCSTRNVEMAARLGADRVVDYTAEDFTQMPERFDVVIDGPGTRKLSDVLRLVKESGTYILIGGPKHKWTGPMGYLLRAQIRGMFSKRNITGMLAKANQGDLAAIADLVEAGEVKAEIEKAYEWKDLPEALAYLGEGHARAKLVVRR